MGIRIRMGPGSVMVVGPMGIFDVVVNDDGKVTKLECINCDFLSGSKVMTAAHRGLVDEQWMFRTETGKMVDPMFPTEDDD